MRIVAQSAAHPTAEALGAAAAESLRRLADLLEALPASGPGPRLVASRQDDELLTRAEAAALLKVSLSKLDRFTRGKPCRRRVGGAPRIERAALLAMVRATR